MDFSSSWKAVQSLVRRLHQQQQQQQQQQTATTATTSDPAADSETARLLHAAQRLSSALATAGPAAPCTPDAIEAPALALLAAPAARWECLCVGLAVSVEALEAMGPNPALSPALRDGLFACVERHLEHPEPRVRALVAKALGALGTVPAVGAAVYERFRDQLWAVVDAQLAKRAGPATMATTYGAAKAVALDDVTGWRALETALLALVAIAERCGPELARQGHVDEAWLERTVFVAGRHANRYVREAAMGMCRALALHALADPADAAQVGVRRRLAQVVAEGLADAWPQVVYAAVRACRALLVPAAEEEKAAFLFPLLLPRLCLSRYYVPEGVQALAQEAWVALFGAEVGGRAVVAAHIEATVDYYCWALGRRGEEGQEENVHDRRQGSHFARIAACYAVKELAAKVDAPAVAPHAARLVGAVAPCLGDLHWEVRSAGCTALAALSLAFPAPVAARRAELVAACLARLEDESWSIREDAALALAAMARAAATAEERAALKAVLAARLEATLGAARSQPPETRAQRDRKFNDPAAHTGRPAFGCCGGLEQPGSHGHAHAAAYQYEAQPWEVSEGALYLLRELCAPDLRPAGPLATADALADAYLPALAEVCRLGHFVDADRLKQSVWKVLPEVTARLGKPALKRHLEALTPALLAALASPAASALTRHAAITCLEQLAVQVGRSIFLGRLKDERERGLFLQSCGQPSSSSSSSAAASASAPGAPTRPGFVDM